MNKYAKIYGLESLFPFKDCNRWRRRSQLKLESADSNVFIVSRTLFRRKQRAALLNFLNGRLDYNGYVLSGGVPFREYKCAPFASDEFGNVYIDGEVPFIMSVAAGFKLSLTCLPNKFANLLRDTMNDGDGMSDLADELPEADPELCSHLEQDLHCGPFIGPFVGPFRFSGDYVLDSNDLKVMWFGCRLDVGAKARILSLLNQDDDANPFPSGTFKHSCAGGEFFNLHGDNSLVRIYGTEYDRSLVPDYSVPEKILSILQESDSVHRFEELTKKLYEKPSSDSLDESAAKIKRELKVFENPDEVGTVETDLDQVDFDFLPLESIEKDETEGRECSSNVISPFNAVKSKKKEDALFLGAFMRPFKWRDRATCAEIEDSLGEVLSVSPSSGSFHPIVVKPFLDKLCDILNGVEVDVDVFPRLEISIVDSKTILNGFELKFHPRLSADGESSGRLWSHLVGMLSNDYDRRIVERLGMTRIHGGDYPSVFYRVLHNIHPFYSFVSCSVSDEIRDMTDLLFLESSFSSEANVDRDALVKEVESVLNGFHSLSFDEQDNDSVRQKTAQELVSLVPDVSVGVCEAISGTLGIISGEDRQSLFTRSEYDDWARVHMVREGDVVALPTCWEDNRFIVNHYRDLANLSPYTVKVRAGDFYERKLMEFPSSASRTLLPKIYIYYNDNRSYLDSLSYLAVPVPFFGKKSVDALSTWLQMNLFLMGLYVAKTPLQEFVSSYYSALEAGLTSDPGFIDSLRHSLEDILMEKSRFIDRGLAKETLSIVIPEELFKRICKVLDSRFIKEED